MRVLYSPPRRVRPPVAHPGVPNQRTRATPAGLTWPAVPPLTPQRCRILWRRRRGASRFAGKAGRSAGSFPPAERADKGPLASSRDILTFSATIWNAGPAQFSIEGFRRPHGDLMDAYEYFSDSTGEGGWTCARWNASVRRSPRA